MIWPVRLSCTRCGRSEDRHPVPVPFVPEGRTAFTVVTVCRCGQEFAWTVVCEGGYVRNVVEKTEPPRAVRQEA